MMRRVSYGVSIRKIMILTVVFATMLLGFVHSVGAEENCYTLGAQGRYVTNAQKAIDRINAIRKEACDEGIINPDTGQPLKPSDYVPIQWSAGLEEIARIRAAEATYFYEHIRPNDQQFYSCIASDGTRTGGETLAFYFSEDMVEGINLWYSEKDRWKKQSTSGETGHYTIMINPKIRSVGLGLFVASRKGEWRTLAGEFSRDPSTNTKIASAGSGIQPISVSKNYVKGFYISGSGTLTLEEHASKNICLLADMKLQGFEKDDYPLKNPLFLLNSGIQWTSASPETVAVNNNGTLYAKKAGSAVVKANTASGMAFSVKVTVVHKTVSDRGVAATCTTNGKSDGSHCSICGKVITAQKEIPAKGHRWSAWKVTKKASVSSSGSKTRTCKTCGKSEKVTIQKLTPTGKTNITSITLKEKQSTTGLRVTGLAYGDKIEKYISKNKKVFLVSSKGKVTAKKSGRADLEIRLKSGKVLKVNVTVQKGKVKTTAVAVKQTKLTLKKGRSFTLKPSVSPFTSQEKITYSSSNKKVATISKKGKITARKKGTTRITVRSGKESVSVLVTVK